MPINPLQHSKQDLHKLIAFIQKIVPVPLSDIEALASKATRKNFTKNELFCREGQYCKELVFIDQGIFRYFVLHKGNDYTKDFAIGWVSSFFTETLECIDRR